MFKRYLYKSYRFFYAFSVWREKKFTVPGLLVVTAFIVSAVLGLDTTQNTIYQLFTFLLPLLVLSMILSIRFSTKISVKRHLPKFATAGETVHYKIEIKNNTSKGQAGLYLKEILDDLRPSLYEFTHAKEPHEDNRNVWDRKILYHRWLWLIRMNKRINAREQSVPNLPPKGTCLFKNKIIPEKRGYAYLKGLSISKPDPFGLFKANKIIDIQDKILVLPRRYKLPPIQLPGSRKYHSGGMALATSVGNSEEFVSLRNYRPGDPLRQVHWKSCAKTGELVIKEFLDEYYVRHALILDTFQPVSNSEIFEEAVSVAASFVCEVGTQESLLDLMFVGDQAFCFSSGRGMGGVDKIMEILACVKESRDQPFSSLSGLVAGYSSLLSACICIFLSWDDERKAFVKQMKAMSVMPIVIVVSGTDVDPVSIDPGPMMDSVNNFHIVNVGKVKEGLSVL